MRSRGWPTWWPWLLIPCGWILASLIGATRGGLLIVDGVAKPLPWTQLFQSQLHDFAWWALLAPLVVVTARRIAQARPAAYALVGFHLLAGAGAVVAYWLLRSRVQLPGDGMRLASGIGGLESSLPSSISLYLLLATSATAYYHHQRTREQERESAVLQLQSSRLETQLIEARLGALRAQLHPHFLFNALHAVSALIDVDPLAARRTLVQLSEALRLALEFSEKFEIPIQREIEWLEHYLELQSVRFGDRLSYSIHVDPSAVEARVPPLVLQPLVENAIKHGIERHAAGGSIHIDVDAAQGRLRLRVTDDGPGLSAAAIEGVGLRNTRQRLAALYGDDATLTLTNVESARGVVATIGLPLTRAGAPKP